MKSDIKFKKSTHKYTRNKEEYISVSELIGRYFSKFDKRAIAKKLSKFPINKANKRGVRYWLKLWDEQQKRGTLVHKDIQDALEQEIPTITDEAEFAIKYLHEQQPMVSQIMTEVVLYNDDYKIAGTADCLVIQDKIIHIYDWKVVKNISLKDEYEKKVSALGLPDSNYWKYTLQLNLYAWMLKEKGYKINGMTLCQLTPTGVKAFELPYLEEVHKILEDRKNEIQNTITPSK